MRIKFLSGCCCENAVTASSSSANCYTKFFGGVFFFVCFFFFSKEIYFVSYFDIPVGSKTAHGYTAQTWKAKQVVLTLDERPAVHIFYSGSEQFFIQSTVPFSYSPLFPCFQL